MLQSSNSAVSANEIEKKSAQQIRVCLDKLEKENKSGQRSWSLERMYKFENIEIITGRPNTQERERAKRRVSNDICAQFSNGEGKRHVFWTR